MRRAVLGCACALTALAGVLVADPALAARGPVSSVAAWAPAWLGGTAAPVPPRTAAIGPSRSASTAPPAGRAPVATPGPGTSSAPSAPARPAIVHRELTAGPDGPPADLVDVDLTAPGVRVGLLTAGDVAGRASVLGMAEQAGARAAVNGDFFDLGRSSAPAGPQVRDGRVLSSAVPAGRRAAPAVPGAAPDGVVAVGADGRARIDRLPFAGSVRAGGRVTPVRSLNAFAVPVGGVGIVTPEWGDADRNRTLCGSDTDRNAPCSADRVEVSVRDGRVSALRPPGAGRLAPGETVLLGRDGGAAALRALRPGEPVDIDYAAPPASGVRPDSAVGGSPILVGGNRPGPLDDDDHAPRTAAGIADGGRRLLLVTVDGRETAHAGVTLDDLAGLLSSLGASDAVNLDGGGSSTMVHRRPGAESPEVVNTPADDATRQVPNALAVFAP